MDTAIDSILNRGVSEVIEKSSLEKTLKSKKALNVKLGIDPTSRELHLGHATVLRKLKEFQDLGHQTYLIFGDFTASIGDPSGVNKSRPVLTEKEINSNMTSYLEQAGKIIDLKKTHIVRNSEWLKTMNFGELLGYTMLLTINQLIEREDFARRLSNKDSVGLHEFLYPLVQAIDSVHLKIDVEIGGWDQLLNLLVARDVQKKLGGEPENLVLMKLVVGTDGINKMSSSKHNFIAFYEKPDQMFGKIMSVTDNQIVNYAELAAWADEKTCREIANLAKNQPRDAKAEVAKQTVALFWGAKEAEEASGRFDSTFRDKKISAEMILPVKFRERSVTIVQAVATATRQSASQARRLIDQKAVKINGQTMGDPYEKITIDGETQMQVGKHQFFSLKS